MPHATPARRATDPTRAATAGLPPIYRAHTLAMEERFQAFAAREAVGRRVWKPLLGIWRQRFSDTAFQ